PSRTSSRSPESDSYRCRSLAGTGARNGHGRHSLRKSCGAVSRRRLLSPAREGRVVVDGRQLPLPAACSPPSVEVAAVGGRVTLPRPAGGADPFPPAPASRDPVGDEAARDPLPPRDGGARTGAGAPPSPTAGRVAAEEPPPP